MLDWGFATYTVIRPSENAEITGEVKVVKGTSDYATPKLSGDFEVVIEKAMQSSVTNEVQLAESLDAPVAAGDEIGKVIFYSNGEQIGECPLVASEDIPRKTFSQIYLEILKKWLR